MTIKRGYSRAFPVTRGRYHRYLLDQIPIGLWRAAVRQSVKEGTSIRAKLLETLQTWVTEADTKGQTDV